MSMAVGRKGKCRVQNGDSIPSKTFFLDTNILMRKPAALYEFADADNQVVITAGVIEEIDKNKTLEGRAGMNCHKTSYEFLALQQRGLLLNGVKTREGGIIKFYDGYRRNGNAQETLPGFSPDLGEGDVDLLWAAIKYKEEHPKENVVLISRDKNVILVAKENGIHAEHRRDEEIDPRKLYPGYRMVENEKFYSKLLNSSQIAEKRYLSKADLLGEGLDLHSNEFLAFVNPKIKEDIRLGRGLVDPKIIFRYCSSKETLVPIKYKLQPIVGVKPRNFEQILAFDLCLDDSVQIVAINGEAGTGKTLIALACALYRTLKRREGLADAEEHHLAGKSPRVYLTKRLISVQGEEAGYLPGDEVEKHLYNYEGVADIVEILSGINKENYGLFNGLGGTTLEALTRGDSAIFEILPLLKIRGKTANHLIVVEEAQNMEPEAIKAMVSRVGNSSIFFTGDVTQCDNKAVHGYDGLTHLVNQIHASRDSRFHDIISTVTLRINERSLASQFAAKYL